MKWSNTMGPADMNPAGLARLERELLRDHPAVLAGIDAAVEGFTPQAAEIEERHGGRELMRTVHARGMQDDRTSPNGLLALVSFLIVLFPVVAFAFGLRGSSDFEFTALVLAVLLASTAVLCVIKILTTLRDRVWVGVMPRWALASGFFSIVAALWLVYRSSAYDNHDAGPLLTIAVLSALVAVAFGCLSLARQIGSANRFKADLAHVQPAVAAYLGEIGPKYDRALVEIEDAVETIEPAVRTKLKSERDAVISNLGANRGLYRGAVPLFVNKKALGELALFAAAEPLVGGGPYPKRGKLRSAERAS